MKTPSIFFNRITINHLELYPRVRLQFSYGIFTLETKTISGKEYCYFYKKFNNKLYKIYVGSLEQIKKELDLTGGLLHKKSMELESKIMLDYQDFTFFPSLKDNNRTCKANPK